MENFTGEHGQIEALRQALRTLYPAYKSGLLETYDKEEAARLGIDWMTRQDIDKFRVGPGNGIDKPRDPRRLLPLWNVVFSGRYPLPTATREKKAFSEQLRAQHNTAHPFFHSCVNFFDVHQHRQTRAKKTLIGRFMFYHFSELFHKFSADIPRAVVIGQWDIDFTDDAFYVEETQYYDGRLGKEERHDVYLGYCLPKGRNICLIMRESYHETPKIYMLSAEYNHPVTHETNVLAGYMLKGSETRKYFRSPVYAVRVPRDKDVERNILRCEDVPAHVVQELEVLLAR